MSERGVFAVDRGVFDHPKFRDDKREFSRLEAWVWLLSAAAWKDHVRYVSGRAIDLKRGQLVASTRTLAKEWRWDEKKVRRFLTLLQTSAAGDAEIAADTAAGITIITICKYNDYQRVSLPDAAASAAQSAAPSAAAAPQQRRIKEDKEYKEVNGAPSAPLLGQPTEEAQLYARGKQVLGKNAGGLIAKLLKSRNGNIALARAAIEQASTKQKPSEYIARIVHGPAGAKVDLADPQDVMRFILS